MHVLEYQIERARSFFIGTPDQIKRVLAYYRKAGSVTENLENLIEERDEVTLVFADGDEPREHYQENGLRLEVSTAGYEMLAHECRVLTEDRSKRLRGAEGLYKIAVNKDTTAFLPDEGIDMLLRYASSRPVVSHRRPSSESTAKFFKSYDDRPLWKRVLERIPGLGKYF